MNRREPLIAGRYAAPAAFLQVLQELLYVFGRQMFYLQLIDLLLHLAGDERDQQSQRIPVTALGVSCQIAFAHQMLQQKTSYPGTKSGFSHGSPPGTHNARSAARPPAATPGSSSGKPAWRRYSHVRGRWPDGVRAFARRRPARTRTSDDGPQSCGGYAANGVNRPMPDFPSCRPWAIYIVFSPLCFM